MSREDFAGVGRRVLSALLGPEPTRTHYDEDQGQVVETVSSKLPRQPARWLEDLPSDGALFLYRYLAQRVAERGGTIEAAESIRHELQAGNIRVAALSTDGKTLRHLDPSRWRGADSAGLFWLAHDGRGSAPNLYVIDVPTQAQTGTGAARQTAKAGGDCQRWLADEMRKSPHKRPRQREDFYREAVERFSGLGKRAFDRAWSAAIADTGAHPWSASGRPRKIRSPETSSPD